MRGLPEARHPVRLPHRQAREEEGKGVGRLRQTRGVLVLNKTGGIFLGTGFEICEKQGPPSEMVRDVCFIGQTDVLFTPAQDKTSSVFLVYSVIFSERLDVFFLPGELCPGVFFFGRGGHPRRGPTGLDADRIGFWLRLSGFYTTRAVR